MEKTYKICGNTFFGGSDFNRNSMRYREAPVMGVVKGIRSQNIKL